MKHNTKITAILMIMFLVTQFIGLFIITSYVDGITLPYGMQPPDEINQNTSIISILFAFAIAITIFIILTRFKAETFIRLWFYAVTTIAIGLALNVFIFKLTLFHASSFIALIIALPLAYYKIFQRNLLVHNLTELLIYPGIAVVFVPILNILGIIILLLIISLYDIWAVWHSEFMQKMAKYQIENLKFFTGFFVPYADKKGRQKIKQLKQKYANKPTLLEKNFKKSRIKVHLAILGGGDIIFPIITAGVFYKIIFSRAPELGIQLASPFILALFSALIIIVSATIALLGLFILARKGKFYPAMPFLTIGMYLGMIVIFIIDLILKTGVFNPI